jgi:hypothetical protein
MKLSSETATFILTIRGYQHPDAAGEPYDANWLSIHVKASGPDPARPGRVSAWTGTDSCLLTYEARRLADWFEAVGSGLDRKGRLPSPAISFLEPVLLFRIVEVNQQGVLRAHFGNLINPSWRVLSGESAQKSPDLWLDFPLSEINLVAVGQSLRQEASRFPDRAVDQ